MQTRSFIFYLLSFLVRLQRLSIEENVMIGNRVNAVHYIACPLCRCKCILPQSGHFPSCVNNDDVRKALNLQDNNVDILDENSDDACSTQT